MADSSRAPDLVDLAEWVQTHWPSIVMGSAAVTGFLFLLGGSRTVRNGCFRAVQVAVYSLGAGILLVGVLWCWCRRAAESGIGFGLLHRAPAAQDDDDGQVPAGDSGSEGGAGSQAPAGSDPGAQEPDPSVGVGSPGAAALPGAHLLLPELRHPQPAGRDQETMDGGALPPGSGPGDLAASRESIPCPSGFRDWADALQGDVGGRQGGAEGGMELKKM